MITQFVSLGRLNATVQDETLAKAAKCHDFNRLKGGFSGVVHLFETADVDKVGVDGVDEPFVSRGKVHCFGLKYVFCSCVLCLTYVFVMCEIYSLERFRTKKRGRVSPRRSKV